jgi:hypothetical protein
MISWLKSRYFIVGPGNSDTDTLWQLCKTDSVDRILDIYQTDRYNVIAEDDNLEAIRKVALKRGSRRPTII